MKLQKNKGSFTAYFLTEKIVQTLEKAVTTIKEKPARFLAALAFVAAIAPTPAFADEPVNNQPEENNEPAPMEQVVDSTDQEEMMDDLDFQLPTVQLIQEEQANKTAELQFEPVELTSSEQTQLENETIETEINNADEVVQEELTSEEIQTLNSEATIENDTLDEPNEVIMPSPSISLGDILDEVNENPSLKDDGVVVSNEEVNANENGNYVMNPGNNEEQKSIVYVKVGNEVGFVAVCYDPIGGALQGSGLKPSEIKGAIANIYDVCPSLFEGVANVNPLILNDNGTGVYEIGGNIVYISFDGTTITVNGENINKVHNTVAGSSVKELDQGETDPTKQNIPGEPTPENPTPENPTPENPTPENPTPENPTPENPTPETPSQEFPQVGHDYNSYALQVMAGAVAFALSRKFYKDSKKKSESKVKTL